MILFHTFSPENVQISSHKTLVYTTLLILWHTSMSSHAFMCLQRISSPTIWRPRTLSWLYLRTFIEDNQKYSPWKLRLKVFVPVFSNYKHTKKFSFYYKWKEATFWRHCGYIQKNEAEKLCVIRRGKNWNIFHAALDVIRIHSEKENTKKVEQGMKRKFAKKNFFHLLIFTAISLLNHSENIYDIVCPTRGISACNKFYRFFCLIRTLFWRNSKLRILHNKFYRQ